MYRYGMVEESNREVNLMQDLIRGGGGSGCPPPEISKK